MILPRIYLIGLLAIGCLVLPACTEKSPPEEPAKVEPVDPTPPQAKPLPEELPAAWTPELVHTRLKAFNPDYNGQAQFRIVGGNVVVMALAGTGITDLTPLKGMPLQAIDARGLAIKDISPLRNMPLVEVYLEDTPLEDLGPLQGLQISKLYLNNVPVRDLSPLKGMPLVEMNLFGTRVEDLSPLAGMPLQMLWLNETPVSDISPLATCPLVSLTLHRTQVKNLSPLAGTRLQRLHIAETPVTDLMPLKDLTLTRLVFTPARITAGLDIARGMASIGEIGSSFEERMSPQQFWPLYDQGQFN